MLGVLLNMQKADRDRVYPNLCPPLMLLCGALSSRSDLIAQQACLVSVGGTGWCVLAGHAVGAKLRAAAAVKLLPWSVRISLGMPTVENIFIISYATGLALIERRGTASGYLVA